MHADLALCERYVDAEQTQGKRAADIRSLILIGITKGRCHLADRLEQIHMDLIFVTINFDFKLLRVWPWPLNFRSPLKSNFPLSKISPWPLTFRGHLRSSFSYHSKAHTWLPILLPLTLSLHLVQFLRFLTSNFSRFDLQLLTFRGHLRSNILCHWKTHTWLPI